MFVQCCCAIQALISGSLFTLDFAIPTKNHFSHFFKSKFASLRTSRTIQPILTGSCKTCFWNFLWSSNRILSSNMQYLSACIEPTGHAIGERIYDEIFEFHHYQGRISQAYLPTLKTVRSGNINI